MVKRSGKLAGPATHGIGCRNLQRPLDLTPSFMRHKKSTSRDTWTLNRSDIPLKNNRLPFGSVFRPSVLGHHFSDHGVDVVGLSAFGRTKRGSRVFIRTGPPVAMPRAGVETGWPVSLPKPAGTFRRCGIRGPVPAPQSGRFSQRDRTPMLPSRNISTPMTKITPWMIVTQAPKVAR